MKLLFESWRRYLNEEKELLCEAQFSAEQAWANVQKKAEKIAKMQYYDEHGKPWKLDDSLSPFQQSEAIRENERGPKRVLGRLKKIIPKKEDGYNLTSDQEGGAVMWLLKQTKSEGFRDWLRTGYGDGIPEWVDTERLTQLLVTFFNPDYKKFFMTKTSGGRQPELDIYKFETITKLYDAVHKARDKIEAFEKQKKEWERSEGEDPIAGTEQILGHPKDPRLEKSSPEFVAANAKWNIFIIKNVGAAKCFGRRGKQEATWCTMGGRGVGASAMRTYSAANDPIFGIENKNTGAIYQFNYGKTQFQGSDKGPVGPKLGKEIHRALLLGLGGRVKQFPFVAKADEDKIIDDDGRG
tara:strand:- start:77 stop:1135 length:1059 start_codon:yes stop_codon:yes gene_type:complete